MRTDRCDRSLVRIRSSLALAAGITALAALVGCAGTAGGTSASPEASASAAPEPVAQSEVVKALTSAGYKATDMTKQAVVDGLDSIEEVTGGSVVKLARDASKTAVYQMNATVARQILKSLRR